MVIVSRGTSNGASDYAVVNGVVVAHLYAGVNGLYNETPCTFIVPPSGTYAFYANSANIVSWAELY